MNPWFARNFIYRPVYAIRGEQVDRFRKEIQRFHALDYNQMLEIQWRKLHDLLRYANQHSDYYNNLLTSHGIQIADIKTPNDYRRIPLLTKALLRENSDRIISKDKLKSSPRKTSGSTGIPLHIMKDRIATAYMDAMMYEVYGWHGISMGDRQARFWGMPLDAKTSQRWELKDKILNRIRMNSFRINEENSLSFYNVLKRFRPKFIYGYPAAISEFAMILKQKNISLADLRIPIVITTGEVLFPEQKKLIENAFACRIVNEYGSTENGIIAFQNPQGRMQLLIFNMYIEIIDPETGAPAKPGEKGQVVITELHSFKLPFIRYMIGDMVALSPEAPQGPIALPYVENIEGRISDMVITADGKKVSGPIINYTMTKGVKRFKAIQDSRTHIEILIEPDESFSDEHKRLIVEKWHALVGADMAIDIKIVNEIPPDKTGKLRSFESRIEK